MRYSKKTKAKKKMDFLVSCGFQLLVAAAAAAIARECVKFYEAENGLHDGIMMMIMKFYRFIK